MDQVQTLARTIANRNLSVDARRNAYSELISLSNSASSDVKKLVGFSIPACFAEFTTLQEEAVDALYDLCEDVDKEVRIVGYKTFDQISRKVVAWVKRNTDVLIQLLQVETEDELSCIRGLLFSHIRISPAPALSVIIDNLCSPDADDRKKETLLDILKVEGKTWIKKDCVPRQASGDENENGQLLREGLEQVLRSSTPSHLLLKIFRLLVQLPFTSSSLPTSILLLRPASSETYDLAFECDGQSDVRAVVLNWFEGGGGAHKCNGEIEEAREFAKWVKKWWQEERNGELERRGSLRWEGETEEETWERWRKLEKSLVSKLAVRVVGHWKDHKPSSGKAAKPIPFPLMEPLLMTLAYLSEIRGVDKSLITVTTLEFSHHLVAQPQDSSWPNALGNVKKMQDNYNKLLSWFRSSRNTPVPDLVPSWQFGPSSPTTYANGELPRPSATTPDTTFIDPLPRIQAPLHSSLPPRPTNALSIRSPASGPIAVEPARDSRAMEEQKREERKRKFAASAEVEKPSKRVAAPDKSRSNGRRRRSSSSASSGMVGIEVISPPSNPAASLLDRITSSTSNHQSFTSDRASFSRVLPLPPLTTTIVPDSSTRQQPPNLIARDDSSSSFSSNSGHHHTRQPNASSSSSSSSRQPPSAPLAPAVASSSKMTTPSSPPLGPRQTPVTYPHLVSQPRHSKRDPPAKRDPAAHLAHLPFHPDNIRARQNAAATSSSSSSSSSSSFSSSPALPLQAPLRQRRDEGGPDLISTFEIPEGAGTMVGGISIRGRAKARAPPPPEPEPERREAVERQERRERGQRGHERRGGGGQGEGATSRMSLLERVG